MNEYKWHNYFQDWSYVDEDDSIVGGPIQVLSRFGKLRITRKDGQHIHSHSEGYEWINHLDEEAKNSLIQYFENRSQFEQLEYEVYLKQLASKAKETLVENGVLVEEVTQND
jgi:predicted GIY-YIG superfamily endonuclease